MAQSSKPPANGPEGVSKRFGGGKTLDKVDLEVPPGTCGMAIITPDSGRAAAGTW